LVISDFSDDNFSSISEMPEISAALIPTAAHSAEAQEPGFYVDFATFDAETDSSMELTRSGVRLSCVDLRLSSVNPMFAIANYLFDRYILTSCFLFDCCLYVCTDIRLFIWFFKFYEQLLTDGLCLFFAVCQWRPSKSIELSSSMSMATAIVKEVQMQSEVRVQADPSSCKENYLPYIAVPRMRSFYSTVI
jgi:hypothetical protein